jgi:hypothetical protein
VVLPPVLAERHTAVNNAFIRNRIESRDILDFAADSLSQNGISGRPIYLYASSVAIRRLVTSKRI